VGLAAGYGPGTPERALKKNVLRAYFSSIPSVHYPVEIIGIKNRV
jgi:hypothetical protein